MYRTLIGYNEKMSKLYYTDPIFRECVDSLERDDEKMNQLVILEMLCNNIAKMKEELIKSYTNQKIVLVSDTAMYLLKKE